MKRVPGGILLLLILAGVGIASYAIFAEASIKQETTITEKTNSNAPIPVVTAPEVSEDKDVVDCKKLKFVDYVNDDSINIILDKVTFCLDNNQETRLTLTSDGGYPKSAQGFFDSVMSHKNRKLLTTIAVGSVNSAGVTMYLAGEQRLITPSTTMLIHLVVSELPGRYDFLELEAELQDLKILQDIQVRITAERSGRPYKEVQEAMIKSTTYDAEGAVKFGIATAIFEYSGS